jgi:hypothetical protein
MTEDERPDNMWKRDDALDAIKKAKEDSDATGKDIRTKATYDDKGNPIFYYNVETNTTTNNELPPKTNSEK